MLQRRRFIITFVQGMVAALIAACRPRSLNERSSPQEGASTQTNTEAAPAGSEEDFTVTGERYARSIDTDIKRRAREDYAKGLSNTNGRLANPIEKLKQSYDVVIIGSGYGAAISAARLSANLRAGKTICILERGKEWVAGDFPDNLTGFRKELRTKNQPSGLYDVSFHDSMVVLQGSGLGGTSLINANVALRPDPEIFTDLRWPAAFRVANYLKPYFEKAESILGVAATALRSSGKIHLQELAAKNQNDMVFQSLKLAVHQSPSGYFSNVFQNLQGMYHRACTFCGDCITGCNVGAKKTLPYNYLALAKRHNTEMYTEVEVDRIEKVGGDYVIHGKDIRAKNWWARMFGADKPVEVRAKMLVLGAGALGSTGILLRSRQSSNFAVSSRLGYGFSGNGDYFSTLKSVEAKDLGVNLDIAGKGAYEASHRIGPTIQSAVRIGAAQDPTTSVVLEDLSVPRALIPIFYLLTGNMKQAMFYLGISDDGAAGRLELDRQGDVRVIWPNLQNLPNFGRLRSALQNFATKLRARESRIVEWSEGRRLVTAHPLGGCCMADSADKGVVNARGEVFSGNTGTAVHARLFVVDGAVIPTSLGANPLLTISAVAENFAEKMLSDKTLFI